MTGYPRLLWLLVDGLPHWLLKRYADNPLTASRIPVLARAFQDDRVSPLLPVWPNCQTPPSLSTLWSGVEPSGTGITGFDLPDLDSADPRATRKAFTARPEHVRWIWDAYGDAGHPVRLCHIPFVSRERLGSTARYVSYGFVRPLRPIGLTDCDGGPHWQSWRRRPVEGHPDADLVTGTWPLECGTARLDLGAWQADVFGDDTEATLKRLRKSAPLLAAAPNSLYRNGGLGPRLEEGGNGTAERVFASALLEMSARFLDEFLDSVAQDDARLVIGYQPALDIMLHEFAGYLDPKCRFWSAMREPLIDDLVLSLMERIDRALARLLELAGPDDRVLVCSDHGMASLDTIIYPNTVLAGRGYLEISADGSIDPGRSVCFFHPAETGALWFNPEVAGREGVSPAAVRADLCRDLAGAPGGAPDIVDIEAPVADGFRVLGHLRPNHCQQAKATLTQAFWSLSRKSGEHGSHRDDPRLRGVVADLSARRQRRDSAPIEARDVAAAFLGQRIPQKEPAHA